MKGDYPCQEPTLLLGKSLTQTDIKFDDNGMLFYQNKKVHGCALVTVSHVPQLLFPFLLLQVNGRNFAALCRSCAEEQATTKCKHNKNDR